MDLDGPPAGMASALDFLAIVAFGWCVCRVVWRNGCSLIRPPVERIFVGPEGHAVFSLPAHNIVSLLDQIDLLQSRKLLMRRLLKE